jgi:hypothetical protein
MASCGFQWFMADPGKLFLTQRRKAAKVKTWFFLVFLCGYAALVQVADPSVLLQVALL